MSDTQGDTLVAQLAVRFGILTEAQVRAAKTNSLEESAGRPFSEFLLARHLVTAEQFWQLERARDEILGRGSAPAPGPEAPAPRPAQEDEPAAVAGPVVRPVSYRPGVSLADLLRQAAAVGANDVHLHSGASLMVRIDGRLEDASDEPIAAEEAARLIDELLDEETRQILRKHSQVDFVYSAPGVGRFRANAYRQQRGPDAVFRPIPERPPTLAELGLPDSLERFIEYHQGLVLFTGPAGCGKSSTMAALVNLINETRHEHIITVEDPIEYVHPSKSCTVTQRQVGNHTESFARALRAALREDPDVIVVGELRDLETVSLALTAAETGHLVLATLHTNNAIRTIHRILGVFPSEQQPQIRMMISESLIAILSQRLLPRADAEGRVAAVEILINNKAIGYLIRDEKTFQIPSAMQTSTAQGMVQLDQALAHLVTTGVVSKEDARRHAEEPDKFD